MSSSDNLEWRFSQVFGEGRNVVEDVTDGTFGIFDFVLTWLSLYS